MLGGNGPATPKSARTLRTVPIAPSPMSCTARRISGFTRIHMASMRKTPAARAVSTTSVLVARSRVNGFSSSTGLPAVRQVRAAS